ncbi:hypothetical protein LX59_02799 [Azomonas agilis]|uniref:Permease n=1 Tax=Azomonas agilis TaxID=116849 RepID=A0A562HZL7_9GAMM|nr:AEC family transporter [Azomonas agilis]TWH64122.1 hypothetical protein LX59_02799 [Azomonas agilis]
MLTLWYALWPLFALILAGQLLRRTHFLNPDFWPGAERLNYFVLFPALLLNSLATAPLDNPQLPLLAAGVFLTLGLAWVGLLVARRKYWWPAQRFGVWVQGILRFNTYLGLAIVGSLYGPQGLALAAVILGLLVPSANLLSVWALTSDQGFNRKSLLALIKNPLILACVAGASINLSGLGLPWGADRLVSLLASASLPLGLLCVGAALQLKGKHLAGSALVWNSSLRLLLMPVIALAVSLALQLPPLERNLLVLFFSLPTAPTAYTLTHQLKGDSTLMANLIALQTLLAAMSLPLVLQLLG